MEIVSFLLLLLFLSPIIYLCVQICREIEKGRSSKERHKIHMKHMSECAVRSMEYRNRVHD